MAGELHQENFSGEGEGLAFGGLLALVLHRSGDAFGVHQQAQSQVEGGHRKKPLCIGKTHGQLAHARVKGIHLGKARDEIVELLAQLGLGRCLQVPDTVPTLRAFSGSAPM
ncbi:MAG: hypothetical protein H0W47_08105 [Polaromonas sp.]|uniref:hypothetical protein n=1 Tax=Polaromonas sp. TaxID=1869339 RepID=UPI00184E3FAD|nr:hypothetical protein [Polaromonas sp.]